MCVRTHHIQHIQQKICAKETDFMYLNCSYAAAAVAAYQQQQTIIKVR